MYRRPTASFSGSSLFSTRSPTVSGSDSADISVRRDEQQQQRSASAAAPVVVVPPPSPIWCMTMNKSVAFSLFKKKSSVNARAFKTEHHIGGLRKRSGGNMGRRVGQRARSIQSQSDRRDLRSAERQSSNRRPSQRHARFRRAAVLAKFRPDG